jgi:hypothetical protein
MSAKISKVEEKPYFEVECPTKIYAFFWRYLDYVSFSGYEDNVLTVRLASATITIVGMRLEQLYAAFIFNQMHKVARDLEEVADLPFIRTVNVVLERD